MSQNFEQNGLIEATEVETGGLALFNRNHVLYRPVGWLTYTIFQILGYEGRAAFVLFLINVIVSSLGLSFSFLFFKTVSESTVLSMLTTMGMATTWTYWRFSTNPSYLPMAVPFVGLALYTFLKVQSNLSGKQTQAVITGIACAGAILVWQANVFLLGILVTGVLIFQYHKLKTRDTLIYTGVLVFTTGIIVGAVYLAISVIFFHVRTPLEFMAWTLDYEGADMSNWGRWGWDRLPELAIGHASSIIPIWEGLGLRNLFFNGVVEPTLLPGQLAVIAYILLCLAIVVSTIFYINASDSNLRLLVWLCISLLIFTLFIMWWDPTEPLWYIISNIFFWGILVLVWPKPKSGELGLIASMLLAIFAIIAIANFSLTIYPDNQIPDENVRLASCVAENMKTWDSLLETDWDFGIYVSYLHQKSTKALFIDVQKNMNFFELVKEYLSRINDNGGRVIMRDLASYSPDQQLWIENALGLTPENAKRLHTEAAFICGDIDFVILNGID
jgi:hypothetical protein